MSKRQLILAEPSILRLLGYTNKCEVDWNIRVFILGYMLGLISSISPCYLWSVVL
ncbi:hypothetical protein VIBNISOn1_370001 [Vibrio nigripulchritudo SOn1]|uniref:Uncharacterized protein n=1 Tax=Vibrio nigripulchritudo SOn1 TaxID=1238450 RepID=A0AAV2VSZ1_9VIBR|nr:hypothetical protein VIBNISOn1_370001 [Vibrio nigripulchritudo SOn1]